MKLIKRNKCAISQADDLEHLYTFKSFPVFMGCSSKPEEHDLGVNMIWAIT